MRPSSSRTSRRARLRRTAGTLVLMVAASTLVSPPVAGADRPAPAEPAAFDPAALAPPSPDLPDLPDVSIELARVPVAGGAFDRAAASYLVVSDALVAARDARLALDRARTAARVDRDRLQAIRTAALARVEGLTQRLDDVEGAVRDLAVRAFVAGRNTERVSQALTSETPSINETDQRAVLGQLSMDVLLAERDAYRQRVDAAQRQADDASRQLAEATATAREAGDRRPDAVASEVAAGAQVAVQRVDYENARVLATVRGAEFPLVALDAYYRAAASEALSRPACGVEWWAVAGIAKVEGRHGTYGGATLAPNGDATRRIIGIQLNGTNTTAIIPDTDDGAFDGDPHFDRAIGPMQFIPSTWRAYAADGNGDGVESPFNLYDATRAAADYLCTSSSGLRADAGLRRAYLSYNHSVAYVDTVLGYARGYQRRIALPARPA